LTQDREFRSPQGKSSVFDFFNVDEKTATDDHSDTNGSRQYREHKLGRNHIDE
jgi:hypothetical protein